MTSTANWLRLLEIALMLTGITALGASFAATVLRRSPILGTMTYRGTSP